MGTTQDEISAWFDAGVTKGATHMIVVCDTFDYTDYPVYVSKGESAQEKFNQNNGRPNMTKAMECYALWKPKQSQLTQRRTFDFEPAP